MTAAVPSTGSGPKTVSAERTAEILLDLDHFDLGLEEILEYLDRLRESGVTNMYGAGPYLVEQFEFDRKLADGLLGLWMNTFASRQEGA